MATVHAELSNEVYESLEKLAAEADVSVTSAVSSILDYYVKQRTLEDAIDPEELAGLHAAIEEDALDEANDSGPTLSEFKQELLQQIANHPKNRANN